VPDVATLAADVAAWEARSNWVADGAVRHGSRVAPDRL
jgi:hypothetical protein